MEEIFTAHSEISLCGVLTGEIEIINQLIHISGGDEIG